MAARTKARKRALDILFEADQRGRAITDTLHDWQQRADPPVQDYAATLVAGVAEHLPQIDEVLSRDTARWPLQRMPSVDRTILRLAAYELVYADDDVPAAVVIDEAVELAKSLSTDESPSFVNGVLARILAEHGVRRTRSGADPSPSHDG